MEKWASKWLEMRSQIHRFKRGGEPPRNPPNERRFKPPLILSPPLAAFAARYKPSAFSVPPATTSLGPALEKLTLGKSEILESDAANVEYFYSRKQDALYFM